MAIEIIPVPDLGGADKVDVIEVCVEPGDVIEAEQSLVVLESDKASMEIPSPKAGKVISLKVKEGDSLSEGDAILELELEGEASSESDDAPAVESTAEAEETAVAADAEEQAPAAPAGATSQQLVPVPDLGGSDSVEVIELCVAVGDEVAEGDSLVVLESDKASMEIPSPAAGKILEIKLAEGDKVSEGADLVLLEVTGSAPAAQPASEQQSASEQQPAAAQKPAPAAQPAPKPAPAAISTATDSRESAAGVYAGPSVRKLARQLGVDLNKLKPSGPRGRFMKDDVRSYVKQLVADVNSGKVSGGSGIPAIPEVDFSQFGDIEMVKMSKIAKLTAANMSRSWLNVPHVTQFDDADITEMEAFRKSMKAEADKRGVKLTPLPFLLKAAAAALEAEPSFNVSLHADGEHIVKKNYIHIGVAVDTPAGLMVPVIRDVNKKGLWELAAESAEIAAKARDGKLMPRDMQGGCFTISSLGAIGGNGFTPIVNAPEVAIMGVSKAQMKPVWNGAEFIPRNMLPLSVSYDHRAINGADCGRFFTYMVAVLSDIRKLLL
ncbi:dihydrolipoyllysine-residue acetyltransferase [Aestuariicella hydrocarbonica]|uniref:Acetyltransferase component of pyruvate dehydrogenase complex n=1 Tax=Pseudomaricurvus hydrocarbonicus TaxID=1470433 RepID=A0A9E5MJJ7_9GAMM|nr:dihydrolipoyllysine-residue acetyltransferase [Aestuariicella hydrocarbonica]